MLRKKEEDVEYLQFELLHDVPQLFHATYLRHGGVSTGPYASLNVGMSVGDDPGHVEENLKKIQRLSGFSHLVMGVQCHGKRVVNVEAPTVPIAGCDGLITDVPGIGLVMQHADCQVALFVDPVQRKVAAVHAGWRGNVLNIYKEAIRMMGSKPEDLLVCISPSLGPHAAEFVNYREEFPEEYWSFLIDGHYMNLWALAQFQLETCGVRREHMQIAGICTYRHPEDYFSYRRERITGRHATIIGWLS